jgi:hypothetical protein
MCTTCLTPLILLELIILIIFDEECKSRSSSSSFTVHSFLSTLFPDTLSLCSALNVTDCSYKGYCRLCLFSVTCRRQLSSFTLMRTSDLTVRYYSFVYFNLHISVQQLRRQNILNRMLSSSHDLICL